ncbi:MAG: alanine dehydrogenase [Rhodospirillaceae bacterium]|nr:alanine dehydrogenase [Rhodospirillaceae bacterium]
MLIGVPKEIKVFESRVGMTPANVRELTSRGHSVLVETNAGQGIDCSDDVYRSVGAEIAASAKDVFAKADMIVKVKEPQPNECKMLREGQVLFTYLHLAPDPEQAKLLKESGCIAIAYETVTSDHGTLPLLAPMSEVAGRMAIQAGARCLENVCGGSGILIGGVPGVRPAKITIIGGGVVGINAARMAIGMNADVTILDRSIERLREIDDMYGDKLRTVYSNMENLDQHVLNSDITVGAVLIPGAAAPKLVTKAMLKKMKKGSVLVDVAIDQGGCFETSKATTHADPIYNIDGIVHYCVANMPGAVAKTSAFALNNATLPYILQLADNGWKNALSANRHLLAGLNIIDGKVTYKAVAEALGGEYIPPSEAIAS